MQVVSIAITRARDGLVMIGVPAAMNRARKLECRKKVKPLVTLLTDDFKGLGLNRQPALAPRALRIPMLTSFQSGTLLQTRKMIPLGLLIKERMRSRMTPRGN